MTDSFAAIVMPVMRHLIDLEHGFDRNEHPTLESARLELMALLEQADQRASTSSQNAHDWEVAKYAVVYWIDEILIGSRWRYADEWRQHILEWDLFRERLRSDRFFERATDAASFAGTDPLEVYYLCVALGFRGRYADTPNNLLKWSERVYGRIVAGSKQPDRFLPDEPRDPDRSALRPLPGRTRLLEMSILVSITALVTLACFLFAARGTS